MSATEFARLAEPAAPAAGKRLNLFERYLTVWVGLCMVVGIVLGRSAPALVEFLRGLEFGSGSQINAPIAVLIWLMIIPMMMKIEFRSLAGVTSRPRGLLVTLFVNWLVKPFSMFFLGWLFFQVLFLPLIGEDLAKQYTAGVIILAAAPCTAMVFVWSYLTDGDPAYTLVQVAHAAHGSSSSYNLVTIFLGGHLEEQYRFLVAHELAHQYFSTEVGFPRDGIGWVPVGLGLMMDEHCAHARGFDATYGRKIMREFYFRAEQMGFDTTLSQSVQKPLQSSPPWSFGWNMSLAHGKAYAVCAMLRDLLGPEKFQDVIRKLIREHAGGLITDADLIRACEAALGEDLKWFTADWIDGRATFDYAIQKPTR